MDLTTKFADLAEYQKAVNKALEIVDLHFMEENPDQIDDALRLYSEDVEWHAPARNVIYTGKQRIKEMYLSLFFAAEGISFEPKERFATHDRVVDDMIVRFKIISDGFENCPYPIGTNVEMRLVHIFHVADGLITRETGYECWRKVD